MTVLLNRNQGSTTKSKRKNSSLVYFIFVGCVSTNANRLKIASNLQAIFWAFRRIFDTVLGTGVWKPPEPTAKDGCAT